MYTDASYCYFCDGNEQEYSAKVEPNDRNANKP